MEPTTIGLIALGVTQACHLIWQIHNSIKSRELHSKCCGAEIDYKSDHQPNEEKEQHYDQPTININIDKPTE